MVWESGVQFQVKSYQRLKKWYLIPPCLTLSIIRYASRVKWNNPGKGVAPSPTPWCSSYWKESLLVALNYFTLLYKMGILESFSLFSTTVWLHHLDASEMIGEKAKWKLLKNDFFCFEQILEAVLYNTLDVWLLTSHFTNHPRKVNKTCSTLRSIIDSLPMYSYSWTNQCRPIGVI